MARERYSAFGERRRGESSQALNRYAYNLGNPVKYVDPNGEFPVLIAAGAAVGGLVAYGMQVHANFQSDPNMGWQAALTTNIDGGKILTAAAVGAMAVVAAPAATAIIGEGLMGAGLTTGSTALFAAGTRATDMAGKLGNAVFGAPTAVGGMQGVIDRGFKGDAGLYEEFKATLQEGLPEGTKAYLRGSVVTDRSWKAGLPFDARGRGTSDLDVALVGKGAMAKWDPAAFYIPGVNSMPLSDETAYMAPGLNGLRIELQTTVGRPVNFQATTDWYLWTRQNVFGQPNIPVPFD